MTESFAVTKSFKKALALVALLCVCAIQPSAASRGLKFNVPSGFHSVIISRDPPPILLKSGSACSANNQCANDITGYGPNGRASACVNGVCQDVNTFASGACSFDFQCGFSTTNGKYKICQPGTPMGICVDAK